MSESAFFDQVVQNIEILISEGKLKLAYERCKHYLLEYPDEEGLQKIKEKIEDRIQEKNDKIIELKLKEAKPLWEKKDYVGVINLLKPLLELDKNNKKLRDRIIVAQDKYSDYVSKLQKKFNTEQTKRLDKLLNEDEDKLLAELFLLERNNPGKKQILQLTALYRDKVIKRRIEKKEDLVYSDKYKDIDNFFDQLRKIDKNNKRLLDLIENTKKRKHGMQVDEKSEYVYKSHTRLDTLMRLGKYDKALKVAEEILTFDMGNDKIVKTKQKAENKLFKQNRESSIDSIVKNIPTLKKEYQKDKSKFIKI